MRLKEILNEVLQFEPASHGYWIDGDGGIHPVGAEQHLNALYDMGYDEASLGIDASDEWEEPDYFNRGGDSSLMAHMMDEEGWIRVYKPERQNEFNAEFVGTTKPAMRSLMGMIRAFPDLDRYVINNRNYYSMREALEALSDVFPSGL